MLVLVCGFCLLVLSVCRLLTHSRTGSYLVRRLGAPQQDRRQQGGRSEGLQTTVFPVSCSLGLGFDLVETVVSSTRCPPDPLYTCYICRKMRVNLQLFFTRMRGPRQGVDAFYVYLNQLVCA